MPPPPRDPTPSPVEDLLAEGPWLRRLAAALLRDGAAGGGGVPPGELSQDDLSQDVMAAALAARPEFSGPRLRGWLRAVARRLLRRAAERARGRRGAEQRAARPEAVEREAYDRLQVHRRLADAVDALPEPYRAAVVMRYLDGAPPRAIAERLGISRTAARQRVSRGLVLLRARLDRELQGGRGAWCAALASFVSPQRSPGSAAALSQVSAAVMLMSTKLALLGAGLGLALGATLLLRTFAVPAVAPPAPVADAGAEPARSLDDAGWRDIRRSAVRAAPPPAAAARVRVVDSSGAAVMEARAAWIDAASVVRALALDADSTAARPEGAAGCRFFARAEGYGAAAALAGEAGDNVEIRLTPAAAVRGRVVEDGGVPEQPVHLWVYSSEPDLGLDPTEGQLHERLEELGVLRPEQPLWTGPDGAFALEGLRAGWRGGLAPASAHVLVAADGGERVSVAAGDHDVVVELSKLPTVFGRLVWADDASPVVGGLNARLYERDRDNSWVFGLTTDAEGRFEIGLPIVDDELAGGRLRRFGTPLHVAMDLSVSADDDHVAFEHHVDLEGRNLPLDLGTLRVERARRLAVLVLGAGGAPVEGAALLSSAGRAVTGADGQVEIEVTPDDTLRILAAGHALHTVAARAPETAPRLEVRLRPGIALRLRAPDRDSPVEVAWISSPFEGAELDAAHATPLPSSLHDVFQEARGGDIARLGWAWSHAKPGAPGTLLLRPPPGGDLLLPGLVGGATLTIRRIDAMGQPLTHSDVVVPFTPGIHDAGALALHAPAEAPAARLGVRVVDGAGAPLPRATVFVRRDLRAAESGMNGRTFYCDLQGRFDLGPMAVGTYDLDVHAPDFVSREFRGVFLAPDAPPLLVELEPAPTRVVAPGENTLVEVQKR